MAWYDGKGRLPWTPLLPVTGGGIVPPVCGVTVGDQLHAVAPNDQTLPGLPGPRQGCG